MIEKSTKNKQASWEVMQAFSAWIFFMLRPDIESVLTLIALSGMLIGLGISPLSIKRDSVPIATASCMMIAFGGAIGGLTIGTLLERLFAETPAKIADSWVASVALICSSLGILAWTFIVLRISKPTRPSLIAIILFAVAGVYSLGYGALTIEMILSGAPQIGSAAAEGLAYILNGSAMVGWALLVTQKSVIYKRKRFLVICLLISGASVVLIGIAHIFDTIF